MSTNDRGREADSPSSIPFAGWYDIGWRLWTRFNDAHIYLFAAGAAFFGLLALVPALAALLAMYGAIFDPATAVKQTAALSGFLPGETQTLVEDQLKRLTSEPSSKLGLAATFSFLFSLWSASSATKAIMDGLNVVYLESEKRSLFAYNATALILTIAGLLAIAVLLGITLILPLVLSYILPGSASVLVWLISYAVLIATLWACVSALYRYAPSREEAKWRWLTPGAITAVVFILVFSIVFSWFARTFSTYSAYGSISAVIGFMTWAWVCMVILLVGAQINAEAEHQTQKDSTTGRPLPLGERGAVMADTVGKSVE
ncbi:MAG: YihY/virulence factor BrkB family protein [Hyphomicrobium sp.]